MSDPTPPPKPDERPAPRELAMTADDPALIAIAARFRRVLNQLRKANHD